jgi:ATP-dependent DNA ligase
VAFDVLALGARDLREQPLSRRRAVLEKALADAAPPAHLCPASENVQVARAWFERFEGAGLDGVVAKPKALPYVAGERVLIKVKHARTADCVVGGYRRHTGAQTPASLLLGLYDAAGVLQFVGAASGFSARTRASLADAIRPYRRDAHAHHPWLLAEHGGQRVPGGPSRWTGNRDLSWEPLRPELVVEVSYDHLQGERFRHATKFLRVRPDREPRSCRYDQLEVAPPAELAAVFRRPGTNRGKSPSRET